MANDLGKVHHLSGFRRARRRVDDRLLGLGIEDGFLGRESAVNILDAEHQARFTGHRSAVGQPSGRSSHRFGEVIGPGRLGIGQKVADLAGQGLDSGEIAEREVDSEVVVINRLGDVDDPDRS